MRPRVSDDNACGGDRVGVSHINGRRSVYMGACCRSGFQQNVTAVLNFLVHIQQFLLYTLAPSLHISRMYGHDQPLSHLVHVNLPDSITIAF